LVIEKALGHAIDNVNPDGFLRKLSAVDQNVHKSGIPPSEEHKFNWIFKNIDFKQWKSGGNNQVLWLSGPPACRIHLAATHIVDMTKADLGPQSTLLYIFCRTVRSNATFFVHVLLHQLLSNSQPLKKKALIIVFLSTLLNAVIRRKEALDPKLWENSERRQLENLLDVTLSSEHLDALAAVLKIEALGLLLIIDELDDGGPKFTRELCAFISQLQGRVKVLFTSRPQEEIKVLLEGVTSIEYDKERRGLVITCSLFYANLTNAECLNTLRFANTRYHKISEGHVGSLQWLWTHEQYQKWTDSDHSSLLYIQGKPGSGKSTLVKYFKENLLTMVPSASTAIIACFFYTFREGEF